MKLVFITFKLKACPPLISVSRIETSDGDIKSWSAISVKNKDWLFIRLQINGINFVKKINWR